MVEGGAGWEPRGVFTTYIPTQPQARAAAGAGTPSLRPGWRILCTPRRPGPGDWAREGLQRRRCSSFGTAAAARGRECARVWKAGVRAARGVCA